MTLLNLAAALMAVVPDTYHYTAIKKPNKYIVWAEDGQADSVFADGRMVEQAIGGTVDYFTRQEFDPNIALIQQALNNCGVAWRLESVQYEDDTKYIHHEWVFEVAGGVA